jgi:hypothetical protein
MWGASLQYATLHVKSPSQYIQIIRPITLASINASLNKMFYLEVFHHFNLLVVSER